MKTVEVRLALPEQLVRRLQRKEPETIERYLWEGLVRDLAKAKFSSKWATIPVGLEIQPDDYDRQ